MAKRKKVDRNKTPFTTKELVGTLVKEGARAAGRALSGGAAGRAAKQLKGRRSRIDEILSDGTTPDRTQRVR